MADFSKTERKLLRDLAADVYEADAAKMLEGLAASFDQWRSGKMLPSELLQADSRASSRRVKTVVVDVSGAEGFRNIVARGLALGLISRDRLTPTLLEKLSPLMRIYPR